MIRFVEDIYADFLYDCYVANQRLTEVEWLYYGREEHHIEIPARDGGSLTPLNSQYLTTYQHWVAGVLQSEVLQKCCFAFVPREALPPVLENMRAKWRADLTRKVAPRKRLPAELHASKIPYAERKPNDRSRKISKTRGNPIILTTPQGQVIRYDSIKLACRIHSLHPGHLREVAQGKRKQHKGYTAQYLPT